MVVTRRSATKNIDDGSPSGRRNEDQVKGVESAEGESSAKRNSRQSPRLKSKRKIVDDELRSKSTGVGVAISIDATSSKKILFDDDEVFTASEGADRDVDVDVAHSKKKATEETEADRAHGDNNNDKDDDDDDAVEEVQGATAKDFAQQQIEEELYTARTSVLTKKSRKRKAKDKLDPADLFDEDFFRTIDAEQDDERKQRNRSKGKVQKEKVKGRHTTFVVSGDVDKAGSSLKPVTFEHNIEVVVLGTHGGDETATDRNTATSITGRKLLLESNKEELSKEALLYSRCGFQEDGRETVPLSQKQLQKLKKSGHKNASKEPVSSWKRSKAMRVVAFGTRKKAAPAARFVVSTSKG